MNYEKDINKANQESSQLKGRLKPQLQQRQSIDNISSQKTLKSFRFIVHSKTGKNL